MKSDTQFSTFFIVGMLESAGWPRKQGWLRKKRVVSIALVSSTTAQLNRIGIVLGAGAPELAAKLLTHAFAWSSRDFENTSIDDYFERYDPDSSIADATDSPPWEVLNRILFRPHSIDEIQETIAWDLLNEKEMAVAYMEGFVRSLVWGLLHHEDARSLIDKHSQSESESATEYQKHGLQIEGPMLLNFDEWLENGIDLVTQFIDVWGELPAVEPTMLNHSGIFPRIPT
jgi:hypothetical protein